MNRNTAERPGFTLLELLVVIAIIGLLVAIMIPGMRTARDQARTIKCLAQVRGAMLAQTLYSRDRNDVILPMAYNMPSPPGDQRRFFAVLAVEGYATGAPIYSDSTSIAETSCFRCPDGISDQFGGFPTSPTDLDSRRPKNWHYRKDDGTTVYVQSWYGLNGNNNNEARAPHTWVSLNTNPPERAHTLSEINRPSDFASLFDGHWFLRWNMEFMAARHRGFTATNIGFFDGHAATVARTKMPPAGDPYAGNSISQSIFSGYPESPLFRLDLQ